MEKENSDEKNLKLKISRKGLLAMEAIYQSPNISQTQLSRKLHSSTAATNVLIKRILEIEPPVIEKNKFSNYACYSLTEAGKQFLKENQSFISQMVDSNAKNQSISDLEKYLMSYILCRAKKDLNPLANSLIEIDIHLFSEKFTFQEFIFLAIQTGILTEDSINHENAYLFSNIKDGLLEEKERGKCLQKFFDFMSDSYSDEKSEIEKKL